MEPRRVPREPGGWTDRAEEEEAEEEGQAGKHLLQLNY